MIPLRYFRFQKAFGGHANDGDQLFVVLRYHGQPDLLRLFEDLGIVVQTLNEPVPGISLIPGTRWVAQPGHTQLHGIRVFVYCTQDSCRIDIVSEVDGGYGIGPQDYAAAAKLEELEIHRFCDRLPAHGP